MCQIKFKSKVDVGAGNFEWIFECLCIPRPLIEIKVTSGNENEAKLLAQQECNDYCVVKESSLFYVVCADNHHSGGYCNGPYNDYDTAEGALKTHRNSTGHGDNSVKNKGHSG